MRFVTRVTGGLAAVILSVSPALAQQAAPKPQTPATAPKPQAPAATPPAPQAAAPKPLAPAAPFPPESKIAFIDMQAIAGNSVIGKAASAKLQDFVTKHQTEISDKTKALQALTQKRDSGSGVLSADARTQLDKDIEKGQRELQFMQQSAQADMNTMQNELGQAFQNKVVEIVRAIGKEKGLYAIYSAADAGALYMEQGLDLSAEVVKRLDASGAK